MKQVGVWRAARTFNFAIAQSANTKKKEEKKAIKKHTMASRWWLGMADRESSADKTDKRPKFRDVKEIARNCEDTVSGRWVMGGGGGGWYILDGIVFSSFLPIMSRSMWWIINFLYILFFHEDYLAAYLPLRLMSTMADGRKRCSKWKGGNQCVRLFSPTSSILKTIRKKTKSVFSGAINRLANESSGRI